MRRSLGLGAISALLALAFAGCGNGKVIGSGPVATPTPGTPNVSYEYKIPTADSGPAAIAMGNDGYLYFTESNASKIGQLTTGGVFKEFATLTPGAEPADIILGANGSIWYTEPGVHKIATMAYSAYTMTEYALPATAEPQFIANGPAQNTMFYTDSGTDAIGEIATDGTLSGPFPIPSANADPMGIALGPDQNMWFCENATSKIGVLNTSNNTISEFALPAGADPVTILQGPDKAMWFTENYASGPKLGRLTTNGTFNEYPLDGAKNATGVYLALDGNLYVADPGNNAIGQFNLTTLTYKEYPVKTANATPALFTTGPDSRLYFTEHTANQIGQFSFF